VELRALSGSALRGKYHGLAVGAGVWLVVAAGGVGELADVCAIGGDGVDIGIAVAL
jgi:hypothetical protein